MTDILEGIVSAETLPLCPREHLGLVCASPAYACICKDVGASVLDVQQDTRGPVAVLTMYLLPNVTDWSRIRKGIQLSGNYRADWKIEARSDRHAGMTVVASWDLWRPENKGLREHLASL